WSGVHVRRDPGTWCLSGRNEWSVLLRVPEMGATIGVRRGCLRLLPDDRPCGQSGAYPERQIYQQQVNREHRPALPKPEIPRAAHRQEKQKQPPHPREEAEKAEKVKEPPSGIYQEPERDTPQPTPEERPVYIRRFEWDRLLSPEFLANPQREQDVAEEDHGQCAYTPRREADCRPLYQGQTAFYHVQV